MEPTVASEALLLPTGTRLIHIGPSKTGTTSLQAAMWAARDAMLAQGVRYAGNKRHSESAARAIAGLSSPLSDTGQPPPIRLWEDLVSSIRGANEPRLVFSSEFLAHARTPAIERLVADIDPTRIHVAVTLRPLGRILASQWQQSIQASSTTSFDDWLADLFKRPDGATESPLWHRHRHDRLIERWAGIVGPERVTAVVVDDRDHAQVLRMFEALLGLQDGTLVLQEDLANRSLTVAEVEALRAFNVDFKAAGLGRRLHTRIVRLGVATHLKGRVPGPEEQRVDAPQWALDRAGEISLDVVANIAASGVRVVGDLSRLTEVPTSKVAGDHLPDPEIPPSLAASLSIGILIAGGFARRGGERPGADKGRSEEPAELARVPSRRVAITLYRRMRGTVRGRYRKARRKVRATVGRRAGGR